MIIKRLTTILAIAAMGVLVILGIAPKVFATPQTCTWVGGASANSNNAASWSGCGGGVPQTGDNLSFTIPDNTTYTMTNGLTNATFGNIYISGGNSQLTVSGNGFSLAGGVTSSLTAKLYIGVSVTLTANQVFAAHNVDFASGGGSLNMNGHDVVVDGTSFSGGWVTLSFQGSLSGTGNISLISPAGSAALSDNSNLDLNGNNSGWVGSVTGDAGTGINVNSATGLGNAANSFTLASGGYISFTQPNGATFPNAISVGGTDAIQSFGVGGAYADINDPSANITLSGHLTLVANTTIETAGVFTLSGTITTNSHTLTQDGPKHFYSGSLVNNATAAASSSAGSSSLVDVTLSDSEPTINLTIPSSYDYIIDGLRGDVTVVSGAILKGTGTIGKLTVQNGGTVAPGHSPGCINVTRGLVLTGNYQAELGGTTACSGYDQLNVTGTVNVSGATLAVSLYNNFHPQKGQTFTIINNDGTDPVTGTFTNLAEGATFSVNGNVFKISYVGGDGNDVVLTVLTAAAPDTGMNLIMAHPYVAILTSTIAGIGILGIARRSQRTGGRR